MDIIRNLIKDYLLFGKKFITPFYKPSPSQWSNGEKGDILLIPGYNENIHFLQTVGEYVNHLGFRIHFLEEFKSRDRIKNIAEKYNEYIERNKLQNLIVISHSKGGIVGKYLMDNYENSNKVIKTLITIATPFSGTFAGNLRIMGLDEIKPKSLILKELRDNKKNTNKIYNIYPSFDLYINENALQLEGAKNVKLDLHGHNLILDSRELLLEILKTLEEL